MSSSKTPSSKLIKREHTLAKGTSHLVIGLDDASAASTLSQFLRAYRGRVDHAKLAPLSDSREFVVKIERIRSYLYENDLHNAELEIVSTTCTTSVEEGELAVEKIRLAIFKRMPENGLVMANQALGNPSLVDLSRMTLLQLKGHCLIMQKKFSASVEPLKSAAALSELFSLAPSAFSTRGFLAHAYAEMGDRNRATAELAILQRMVEQVTNDELWLHRLISLLRAEVNFHRALLDDTNLVVALKEAQLVARWLEYGQSLAKCNVELAQLDPTLLQSKTSTSACYEFSGWSFLPRQKALLWTFPKRVFRLNSHPVSEKIILNLLVGPKSLEELFSEVWDLPFVSARHITHVRSAISKLRKVLPNGALVVHEGLIYLK